MVDAEFWLWQEELLFMNASVKFESFRDGDAELGYLIDLDDDAEVGSWLVLSDDTVVEDFVIAVESL